MLFALRAVLCTLFLISGIHAEEHEDRYTKHSMLLKDKNDKIFSLKSKLKSQILKSVEKKQFQKEKSDLVLESFKLHLEKKDDQRIARHEHARRHERIDLKYSPRGVCKNPCNVNLEAVVSKKSRSLIGKYVFYIDDKSIESATPKLSTTIYFAKSMLTDKQKRLMSKNIPLHRIFKLRVEGIISETKMLESESKKLVIKSFPSNLTNVEIITNKVLPYGKIQIAISGISVNQLKGSINSIPLSFEVDPIVGSSQVLYTMAPYLTTGIYKLSIANFYLSLEIGQMPVVSNSSEYVNNISNNSVNLGSVITESGRFNNLLSSDGMALFSKYNEVVNAFDNYIKNEATPAEIQEIANIINANTLSDSNTYFFVKNKRESIRNFFSNLDNKRLVTKVISIFIESSYAQENSQNLLKNLLYSKITEAMKFALTSSFNTLIDGMINKCYVSKGRTIPSSVVLSEKYLTKAFAMSAGAVILNQFGGAYGYYATISAAQALVILIGNDCEGDSTIVPKLVIQSQQIAPIIPGESIDFGVKCDVGDSRYYTPGSILTRVTSKFDYISEELKETGDLIARDKLVHSCSGLGQDAIKDNHNIHCTTNLLEETSYYQNNSSEYETINPAQCNGGNDYYDVGTYLVSSPDFSCNFVNPEKNVNIIGKKSIANQLVFDLSKQMKCPPKPKAVINYTKNNLVVNFDSTGNTDLTGLTYSWNFGDGQTSALKAPTHNYSQAGTYNVSLIVTDSYGASDSKMVSISVQGNSSSVRFCNTGLLGVKFHITDTTFVSLKRHQFLASNI